MPAEDLEDLEVLCDRLLNQEEAAIEDFEHFLEVVVEQKETAASLLNILTKCAVALLVWSDVHENPVRCLNAVREYTQVRMCLRERQHRLRHVFFFGKNAQAQNGAYRSAPIVGPAEVNYLEVRGRLGAPLRLSLMNPDGEIHGVYLESGVVHSRQMPDHTIPQNCSGVIGLSRELNPDTEALEVVVFTEVPL